MPRAPSPSRAPEAGAPAFESADHGCSIGCREYGRAAPPLPPRRPISSPAPFETLRPSGIPTRALSSLAATSEGGDLPVQRSEEHTSELQSLMRISYDVFCLKKK